MVMQLIMQNEITTIKGIDPLAKPLLAAWFSKDA
jgi:hypothetical protein